MINTSTFRVSAVAAAMLLMGISPSSAQQSPLVDAIYGAGIGGGIGAAIDGKKGAQKGAIVGGVLGLAQGLPTQYPSHQTYQPYPSYQPYQPNPLASGLVGAGVGGGIGAAVGGKKGAQTGAIVGGATGLVYGAAQQPPSHYQPRYAPPPVYAAPAPRYQPPVYQVSRSYAPSSQFVANVQRSLINLGYDPGVVDGRMGPSTRSAIVAYERNYGLPLTGRASAELLAHMHRQGG